MRKRKTEIALATNSSRVWEMGEGRLRRNHENVGGPIMSILALELLQTVELHMINKLSKICTGYYIRINHLGPLRTRCKKIIKSMYMSPVIISKSEFRKKLNLSSLSIPPHPNTGHSATG